MPMIATTIISSINVKPCCGRMCGTVLFNSAPKKKGASSAPFLRQLMLTVPADPAVILDRLTALRRSVLGRQVAGDRARRRELAIGRRLSALRAAGPVNGTLR